MRNRFNLFISRGFTTLGFQTVCKTVPAVWMFGKEYNLPCRIYNRYGRDLDRNSIYRICQIDETRMLPFRNFTKAKKHAKDIFWTEYFALTNFNLIRSSIKYPFEIETATGTHTRRIIIRDLSPRFISSVTISILISSYHKLDRSLTSPAKVKRYYLIVREGGGRV